MLSVWVGLLPEEGSGSRHWWCSEQLVTVAGPRRAVCLGAQPGHREAQRSAAALLRGPVVCRSAQDRPGLPAQVPVTALPCWLCEWGAKCGLDPPQSRGWRVSAPLVGTVPDSACGAVAGVLCLVLWKRRRRWRLGNVYVHV